MATSYQSQVIADGASNYWPLDDPSGTVARDLAGSAPGTISGGVTLNQPGVTATSKAMTFDGTSGHIETAAPVTIPAVVTIEAWAKPGAIADYSAIFSSRFTAGGIAFGLLPPSLPFSYSDGATPAQANGIDVPLNQWSHLVLVHSGATVTFYANGVLQITNAQVRGAQAPKIVGIGANAGGTSKWPGSLQDIAIYPRALTPAEIAAHNTLGRTTTAPDFTSDAAEEFPMLECNHASIIKTQSGSVTGTPVYLPAACNQVSVIVDSEGAGAGSFQLQSCANADFTGTWANVGTAVAAVAGGSANAQHVGTFLALRLVGTGVVAGCTARIVAVE